MEKELVREEKMTDRLKQLAQQTIDVIGCEKLAPEVRLRIIKAYMLGLVDGITVTKGTELDTCTKCGKKTGQASFVLGHTGLYCPECSAELCREPENSRKCPYDHVMGRDFCNYADCAKCAGASYHICEMKKDKEQGNNEKTPRIKEFPNLAKDPRCSICNSGADLLNILTSEGGVLSLCSKCRKALEDPKVQEALHKG